uniref:DNA-directed DNA polymerase n=1 Tax=Eptatretus burgeri TaxID=7764 RepID=A0A8C4QAW4_EPTBU
MATDPEIAVSATVPEIAVSATVAGIVVRATVAEIAVSATVPEIVVRVTVPEIAVSVTVAAIEVGATVAEIVVSVAVPEIVVSAAVAAIEVGATVAEIVVGATVSEIAVSAAVPEIAVSAAVPEIAVSSTVPEIVVGATVPGIAVGAIVPEIVVSATVAEIGVSATVAEIVVGATVPGIAVGATVPLIVVSATVAEIGVSATVPEIAVSATVAEIVVGATVAEIVVSATVAEIAESATVPDIVVSAAVLEFAVSATVLEIVVSATVPEIALSATLPEIVVGETVPEIVVGATVPEIVVNATVAEIVVSVTCRDCSERDCSGYCCECGCSRDCSECNCCGDCSSCDCCGDCSECDCSGDFSECDCSGDCSECCCSGYCECDYSSCPCLSTAAASRPHAVSLEVYLPCVLQTKKRYMGYMYESPQQEQPVFDAKGIETVRRDGCPAVSKVLERTIQILFDTKDVSAVRMYVQRQCSKLLSGKSSLQDLIFAKEYRGLATYRPSACVPALHIARKLLASDPRAEPRVGERVPYVIVNGPPGLPLIKLVERPLEVLNSSNLVPNVQYYVRKQLLPALQRVLSLIGVDVFSWYQVLPRVMRVPCRPRNMDEGSKSTIVHYFGTTRCAVCSETATDGLCSSCTRQPQRVAAVLMDQARKRERKYHHLLQVFCFDKALHICNHTTLHRTASSFPLLSSTDHLSTFPNQNALLPESVYPCQMCPCAVVSELFGVGRMATTLRVA